MSDGFGENVAAKASQEATYYISIKDGTVKNATPPSSNREKISVLTITSTVGSFQLTQASRLAAQAIATTQLHGTVVDWGCGGGVLALLAASQPNVKRVIGLDYEAQNIVTCRYNARQNGLEHKTEFYRSDSFHPFDHDAKETLLELKGQVDFVIANPPASTNDDGFSFRRRILKEAMPFLKRTTNTEPSQLLLQALSYYGSDRFVMAAKDDSEFWSNTESGRLMPMEYLYQGIVKSSPWMELGAGPGGYDFTAQMKQYCREEERGGMRYFCGPNEHFENENVQHQLTAVQAMSRWEEKQIIPRCQWQVHALEWRKKKS